MVSVRCFLPSPGHTWQHDGHCAKLKSQICPINDALINNTHSRDNEYNSERAINLLNSGSIHCSTAECMCCKSRTHNNLNLTVFRVNATPSMKRNVQNETSDLKSKKIDHYCAAFLAFNIDAKELLPCPCSMCGCYDGRHFCSHESGFLFFIR